VIPQTAGRRENAARVWLATSCTKLAHAVHGTHAMHSVSIARSVGHWRAVHAPPQLWLWSGIQVKPQRVQPPSEMVLGPLEGDPVRLEAGVNTRVVDLDHEVAVVIVRNLREYCVEIDHAEARLGPEPLAR
jgi:hypothetical protein